MIVSPRTVLCVLAAMAVVQDVSAEGTPQLRALKRKKKTRRVVPKAVITKRREKTANKVFKPPQDFSRKKVPTFENHVCAEFSGDPHIKTWDGLKFDCQGVGEFVMAKSLDSAFEIQAQFAAGEKLNTRYTKVNGIVSQTHGVSVETGVDGVPDTDIMVIADWEKKSCKQSIFVDGEFANFGKDGKNIDGIEFYPKVQVPTARGGMVEVDYIYYTGSGVLVTSRTRVGGYGCVMDSKICLPPELIEKERIVGLLGTPNGNSRDDWVDPFGKDLQHNWKLDYKLAYEYCTANWCVADESDSIFDTHTDASPVDRSSCQAPYNDGAEVIIQSPTPLCANACADIDQTQEPEDWKACILECEEGEVEDAEALKVTKEVMEVVQEKVPDPDAVIVVPRKAPPMEVTCLQDEEGKCLTACPIGQKMNKKGKCVLACGKTERKWKGRCVPKCPSGFQRIKSKKSPDGECVIKCAKTEQRWKGQCKPRCNKGESRTKQGECRARCTSDERRWKGKCVKKCDEGTKRNKKGVCVKKCPKGFFKKKNGECKKRCESGFQRVRGKDPCVPKCPKTHFRNKKGDCIAKCPEGQKRTKLGKCVVKCLKTEYRNKQGLCIEKCPTGMQRIKGQGECVPKCVKKVEFRNRDGVCIKKCTKTEKRWKGTCYPKCQKGERRISPTECQVRCTKGQFRNKEGQCQKKIKKVKKKKRKGKNAKKKLKKRKRNFNRKAPKPMMREIAGECIQDHVCGSVRGDPHITTYDGLKYDCQGKGEFVLAKSLDSDFEVQGRFSHGNNKNPNKKGKTVTITQGISIDTGLNNTSDVDIFIEELDDRSCVLNYYIDGEPAQFGTDGKNVTGVEFMPDVGGTDYLYFEGNGVLFSTSGRYGNRGCVMNSKLCLPPEMVEEERIVGLLGSPNSNKADDWMDELGNDIKHGGVTGWKTAYDYCVRNWCVHEPAKSIFGYLEGTSWGDFEGCKDEYDASAELAVKNPSGECKTTCAEKEGTEEYDQCLLECEELGAGDAVIDKQMTLVLKDVEKKCPGPEVEIEIEEERRLAPPKVTDAPTEPPVEPTEPKPEPTEPKPEPTEPVQVRKAPSDQGGAFGDPHVRTWSGEHYSYHGACDLVLVHNPGFMDGLGMDVHIRNMPVKHWSYIDSAVLRIGGETLEVRGGETSNEFYINGILGNPALEDGMLPETIAGFPIKFDWLTQGRRRFVVDLGDGEEVIFKTFKYFIRVNVRPKKEENFNTAVGLMGSYPSGKKVARDGVTELTDYNQFGQEWQVLASEPHLFHSVSGPQAPQQCAMPVATTQRRLAESSITLEDAQIACSHILNQEEKDECVFDVLATEDKDMAGAY